MNYTLAERNRLLLLIGLRHWGHFAAAEEVEMRELVAKEFPADTHAMSLELLEKRSLGILAAYMLFPDLGEAASSG